jgi:uncharacterized damage-inducible protein DinB
MLIQTLQVLFDRDLTRLKTELAFYKDEKAIWYTGGSITNSAGNLCLHLIGNLNTYIGATLGDTGYVRQRDLEFSRKNVPRDELITMLDEAGRMVKSTLNSLKDDDLKRDFPVLVFADKRITTTEFMLVHMTTHLNYHLGQINYHRRLLDEGAIIHTGGV